jgi:hypothetical protein
MDYDHELEPCRSQERKDTMENEFRIYYVTVDDKQGYVERIELPNGETVLFDQEKGCIDFEPMRPYIGSEFLYFMDGDLKGTKILTGIDTTSDGVKYFIMGDPDGKEK